MNSRKSGFLGLVRRRSHRPGKRSPTTVLRRGLIETLEKRELLSASPFNPSALFGGTQVKASTIAYVNAASGGLGHGESGSFGLQNPEGAYSGEVLSFQEVEPNNSFAQAQFLSLGNAGAATVTGIAVNNLDVDWYSFDLKGGDILDLRLISNESTIANQPLLALYDSGRTELVLSRWRPGQDPANERLILPANSPLTGSRTAPVNESDLALHYVIPRDGRYYVRISDLSGSGGNPTVPSTPVNYSLNIRRFRPVLESEPAGTVQRLFLDFEGGIVNRVQFFFGIPGSARLSPTRDYLQAYGLRPTDEHLLIDAVVQRVQSKFDALASATNNPNFAIDILNSKDHADPWGQPHVSRVIVGGTFQELVGDPAAPSGLLGVAQSVDPGNFDTAETALVMHDYLLSVVDTVPIAPTATRLDLIAELLAMVITHEAGHYFGGWHQFPGNAIFGIMDQFFDPIISSGAGSDGIFGTADDQPLIFGVDRYAQEVFLPYGVNDSINAIGWALPGVQNGGRVEGIVYVDQNLNRTLDSSDGRLQGVIVYSDLNNNGIWDAGEHYVVSRPDGTYRLPLPAGTHTVRAQSPTGTRPVAPAGNSYVVNVVANTVATNRHFGFEQIQTNYNGIVWNDLNGNGVRDAGEPGIGNVWVYLDLDGDGRLDIGEPAVRTKSNGTFTFPTFPPNLQTATVRMVVDPGWEQTYPGPATNFGHTITVTGDPEVDIWQIFGRDFGVTKPVPVVQIDYGDAPQSYGLAGHHYLAGLRLGTAWDAEPAPHYSANADGDDLNGVIGPGGVVIDDEDGVILVQPLVRGSNSNQIEVTVTNTTGQAAYLNAWMDFNGNGVFDTNEKIFDQLLLADGTHPLNFSIPVTAQLGDVFARFRYSLDKNLGPTGLSNSGEVEDYKFTIVQSFNLAVDDTATVAAGSILNPIDVLANDFRFPDDILTVLRTSGSTTAGGQAIVSSDRSRVFYTPPAGFIGVDTFTYTMENSRGQEATALVVVTVNLVFDKPLAIDDSFEVATNAVDVPLNVLANDIEGRDGALSIVSVTQPDKGGQITIAPGGKSLRYTPALSFGGTEFFSYTAADSAGNTTSAKVTLHTLPGARLDDQVLIQLVATDLAGNPISSVQQGQDFKIRVVVDDLRHDTGNPGLSAGVFAAYFDLLYNMQLVSLKPNSDPAARFNFAVNFLNGYVNATTGDGTIPGIINEFGATSSSFDMQNPNPVSIAEITFTARAAGVVDFVADPADLIDFSDTLLFNQPFNPVPIEKIRYLGTQIQVFGDGAEFPQAVDDSLPQAIPVNAIRFPIDVLANDLRGSTGNVSIASTGQGSHGTVFIENRNGNPADPIVTYTPNVGFAGFDQFTYVIQDSRGIQSQATVSVRVGNLAGVDTVADFDIVVTDLSGQPIDQVTVGSQFQVRAYVQDVRGAGANRGLYTAYMDLLYNASLVSPIASSTNDPNLGFVVSFGPSYGQVREGDIRIPGIINEIGAQANSELPVGTNKFLLFTVTMTANSVGTATFVADPADVSPFHDTLTYIPAQPVPLDKIRFGVDQLQIVAASGNGGGEFHNAAKPLDVNNDGYISAIDALLIINHLNGIGLMGGGEGESGVRFYPDTNGDNRISAIDALLVINHMNSRSLSGQGEGESAAPAVTSTPVAQRLPRTTSQPTSEQFELSSAGLHGPATPDNYYAAYIDGLLGMEDDEEDSEDWLLALASDVEAQLGGGL